MTDMDDGSPSAAPRHAFGVRFDPVITVGNLISIFIVVAMSIGGLWGVYTSIEKDIAAINQRISAQDTAVSLVKQQADNSTAMISQDRTDAKAFSAEMRASFDHVSEQISKLREDLARNGAIKSH